MPRKQGELLTVNEAARRLGVHPATIRKWIACGAMWAKKVGPTGLIRITEREVSYHLKDYEPPQ